VPSTKHSFHLRYRSQADIWNDALPLGNGRLGAMVYGHVGVERVQLNDDSLWYGTYQDRNNPSLREVLPEIRRLVLSGGIYHAEELILQNMVGTPYGMCHYSPLGELDQALNRHLPFGLGWTPKSDNATD
jgi:alpha-L-fucosidase 2